MASCEVEELAQSIPENSSLDSKIINIKNTLNLILNGDKAELDTSSTSTQTKLLEQYSHLRFYKLQLERKSISNALIDNKIFEALQKLWKMKGQQEFFLENGSSHLCRIYLSLIRSLLSATDRSDELCKATLESGIIELFMKDLSSQKFIEKIQEDPMKCKIAHSTRLYMGIFHNIVQRDEIIQKTNIIFREYNAIEILKQYLITR